MKRCRYCQRDTYKSDERGPVHPCCRFWIEDEGERTCAGCSASRSAESMFKSKGAAWKQTTDLQPGEKR